MTLRRYGTASKIKGGTQYGTSTAHNAIRRAAQNGAIDYIQYVLQEGERIDNIAGRQYGNSRLWWIIAAASGIGWGLQAPPGTLIYIPTNLSQISQLT